jgi:hypothetical protein
MGWEEVAAGIGGGLSAGVNQYNWQKDYEQKDRAIDSRTQIEQLKLEVREMIAQLNEQGRNERWATPSGNIQTQQQGATERATMAEEGRNDRWATPSGNAFLSSETSRRGQDLNFDLGIRRDTTTQRGQDITATTARRGQDVGATTSRRGQDLTFKTAEMRDVTDRRGQDLGATTQAANEQGRNTRAAMQGVNFYGATPVTAPQGMRQPVSAPAPAPSATNDQTEAARLIAAFDAEKDPVKKAALQKDMQAVLQRLKGGGR